MTTVRAEHAWSYASTVDVVGSLSSYLKFLKSKPRLAEILFYLQSTFILGYGSEALGLYSINSQGNLTCLESTGQDVLTQQGMTRLVDIKNVIPAMQPTQAEPITDYILMSYESSPQPQGRLAPVRASKKLGSIPRKYS